MILRFSDYLSSAYLIIKKEKFVLVLQFCLVILVAICLQYFSYNLESTLLVSVSSTVVFYSVLIIDLLNRLKLYPKI